MIDKLMSKTSIIQMFKTPEKAALPKTPENSNTSPDSLHAELNFDGGHTNYHRDQQSNKGLASETVYQLRGKWETQNQA